MRITRKDFERRCFILNDILEDRKDLFYKYIDFSQSIKHKLNEREFATLKSLIYGLKSKIVDILAKSNRIKISYDKTLKYIDFDALSNIFEDLDEEKKD